MANDVHIGIKTAITTGATWSSNVRQGGKRRLVPYNTGSPPNVDKQQHKQKKKTNGGQRNEQDLLQ